MDDLIVALRRRLQTDLRELFERLEPTVVHVTHDVGEAFELGDQVAVLREGRVAQTASPDELWARPADDWVARFLGMTNVERDGDRATVVRPEAVQVRPGGGDLVVAADRDGAVVRLRVRREDGVELDAAVVGVDVPSVGDGVTVEVDPAGVLDVPVWRGEAAD